MSIRTLYRWTLLAALQLAATAQAAELTLYLMEVPPLTMNETDRKGVVGDIVLEAIHRSGYNVKLQVVPSNRAMLLVQADSAVDQLIIPLARQKAREDHFTWIAPITKVNRAFFTRGRKLQSFDEARTALHTVAVGRGTAGVNILREQGFADAQIYEVADNVSAAKMMQAGRVDAWYGPVIQFKQYQHDIDPDGVLQMGAPLGSTFNYLACSRRCDQQMTAMLADAIVKMRKDGTIKAIEARYGIYEP